MTHYPGGALGHSVAAIEDGCVVLEDGSRWSVYAGFQSRAAAWVAGEMITVKNNRDEEYPYLLVNVHRNESVEVRLEAAGGDKS